MDSLLNYETVKMFGMEEEESSLYARLQQAYQDAYIWFRMTLNSLNFGQSTIQALGLGSAMIFAAIATAQGKLTPGDFVLVNTYVSQLFQPLFVSFVPLDMCYATYQRWVLNDLLTSIDSSLSFQTNAPNVLPLFSSWDHLTE